LFGNSKSIKTFRCACEGNALTAMHGWFRPGPVTRRSAKLLGRPPERQQGEMRLNSSTPVQGPSVLLHHLPDFANYLKSEGYGATDNC
jgi:hypothetical protein